MTQEEVLRSEVLTRRLRFLREFLLLFDSLPTFNQTTHKGLLYSGMPLCIVVLAAAKEMIAENITVLLASRAACGTRFFHQWEAQPPLHCKTVFVCTNNGVKSRASWAGRT